ncbi:MAG: transposase [Kribbellaceae bacterium]
MFAQHPDYRIITPFVGAADMTGARLLGEIGDDKTRFADARALKAFAGSAPVTKPDLAHDRGVSLGEGR